MYLIQLSFFVVLLLHQSIVDGFNIFNKDFGVNYLNTEINSKTSSDVSDVSETRWILQEIDHFNSSEKRMWQMKFYEGLKYWRENGPIYLFLGTVGGASVVWAYSGIMKDLAKETHGAMYIPEHRYYGDSKPFADLNAENMKYLSSRQALADIAKLIINLKSLPMYKDSKVVVIGGSYGGNLAVWMKVLYPKLIDAAISSSAPVLAQKDFYKSLEKVKDNYNKYGGAECLERINNKFLNFESLLWSPEGIKQLKKETGTCDSCDLTIKENQQLLFFGITFIFVELSARGEPDLIKLHCDNLDNITDYRSFLNDPSKVINSGSKWCECRDFNQKIKEINDQRNFGDIYPWLYQTCTEFGQFPTTSSKNQPFFNIPLEFYIKICSGLFGKDFTEKRVDKGVDISNKLYGGLKPNVTNVVFTNGELDPWSTLSILKDLSYDAQALVIPRAAQYEDLLSETFTNTIEVNEARKVVKYLIKKWIGAYE